MRHILSIRFQNPCYVFTGRILRIAVQGKALVHCVPSVLRHLRHTSEAVDGDLFIVVERNNGASDIFNRLLVIVKFIVRDLMQRVSLSDRLVRECEVDSDQHRELPLGHKIVKKGGLSRGFGDGLRDWLRFRRRLGRRRGRRLDDLQVDDSKLASVFAFLG